MYYQWGWAWLPHSPQYYSQGVAINNKLVLLGGLEASSRRVTNLVSTWTDVCVYNPDSKKWSKVGQLSVPRARCTVVSLSRTSFIVCGGCADTSDLGNTGLTSVEVVHV